MIVTVLMSTRKVVQRVQRDSVHVLVWIVRGSERIGQKKNKKKINTVHCFVWTVIIRRIEAGSLSIDIHLIHGHLLG